jgi:hypothetical protein
LYHVNKYVEADQAGEVMDDIFYIPYEWFIHVEKEMASIWIVCPSRWAGGTQLQAE